MAASELTQDPTMQVLCPDCGQGTLIVRDEKLDGSHIDRHISCAACGAKESIFLNTTLRQIN
jgi:predicted RNA-binding Zn-ribbon protein involved in translation (DUF1610 family)